MFAFVFDFGFGGETNGIYLVLNGIAKWVVVECKRILIG
jgi:hypothetical protein